jgi:hypothetical protein
MGYLAERRVRRLAVERVQHAEPYTSPGSSSMLGLMWEVRSSDLSIRLLPGSLILERPDSCRVQRLDVCEQLQLEQDRRLLLDRPAHVSTRTLR